MWTNEGVLDALDVLDVLEGVETVQTGKMSINIAARAFDIPSLNGNKWEMIIRTKL